MTRQLDKMSAMMQEMSEHLLRISTTPPSSEAMHVALFFASTAWNESVGLTYSRDGYRQVWETIEADNPALWDELKSSDVDKMIDELVGYKKAHYPDDQRRILICGIVAGKIRVEWLPAAASGVDSKWEMRLYGLVSSGDREAAIRFLQSTRSMSRHRARAQMAAELGIT
jgi:hypothetical protein